MKNITSKELHEDAFKTIEAIVAVLENHSERIELLEKEVIELKAKAENL